MKKQTKLGLVLAAAALISVSVASLVSAKGWVQEGADWRYLDSNGDYMSETIQASGNAKFYLDENGYMAKDFFLEDYGDNNDVYYFGSNGAMVTNTWVAIEAGNTENKLGDYEPDNFWYYFQASGKAIKAQDGKIKKTSIDGKTYAFNQYGQMCVGWVQDNGETIDPDTSDDGGPFANALYYAGGDNDGALRSGWVTYYDGYNGDDAKDYQTDKTNLYFWFDTSSHKKFPGYPKSDTTNAKAKTKKINGKTYAFNDDGMMLSGWDTVDDVEISSLNKSVNYFSGDDDGHQVKKGWVYAVPAKNVDKDANEKDEEKYFYFGSDGKAVTDTVNKKVNNKYYAFNYAGIMKTGLAVASTQSKNTNLSGSPEVFKFIGTLDLDYAEGSDITKKGKLVMGGETDDVIYLDEEGKVLNTSSKLSKYEVADRAGNNSAKYPEDYVTGTSGNSIKKTVGTLYSGLKVKLHYFGEDGARKIDTNTITFSDGDYTFKSNSSGNVNSSGVSGTSKKYYALGIQVKANPDIKYGIFVTTNSNLGKGWFYKQSESGVYKKHLDDKDYIVLNTSGSKQKGGAKKDANDNWWLINDNDKTLIGIYTKEVKAKNFSATYDKLCDVNDFDTDTEGNPTETPISSTMTGDLKASVSEAVAKKLNVDIADITNKFYIDNEVTAKYVNAKRFDITIKGYGYKTTVDSSDNAWLPFGVADTDGNYAQIAYTGNSSNYQFAPNNDYFLNCYWED